jgi:hypothetical protein
MGWGALAVRVCLIYEVDISLRMTVVLGTSWGNDNAISAC